MVVVAVILQDHINFKEKSNIFNKKATTVLRYTNERKISIIIM